MPRFIAHALQFIFGSRGYGRCGRCGLGWNWIGFKYHTTDYENGHGCFPLCQHCWVQLTPRQRLPYYKRLFSEWFNSGGNPDLEEWPKIQKAVMEGK